MDQGGEGRGAEGGEERMERVRGKMGGEEDSEEGRARNRKG